MCLYTEVLPPQLWAFLYMAGSACRTKLCLVCMVMQTQLCLHIIQNRAASAILYGNVDPVVYKNVNGLRSTSSADRGVLCFSPTAEKYSPPLMFHVGPRDSLKTSFI